MLFLLALKVLYIFVLEKYFFFLTNPCTYIALDSTCCIFRTCAITFPFAFVAFIFLFPSSSNKLNSSISPFFSKKKVNRFISPKTSHKIQNFHANFQIIRTKIMSNLTCCRPFELRGPNQPQKE